MVDNATLFPIKVKYKEILQEQFEGLVAFFFTPFTCISNVKARIFLDTHKKCVYQKRMIIIRTY